MGMSAAGSSRRHIGKVFAILSAWLTATGQLYWKWGYEQPLWFIAGFACYGAGAVLLLSALSREKLSVAYPLLSLSYVFALLYGAWLLGEPVTAMKLAAVALIGAGVSLIASGQ